MREILDFIIANYKTIIIVYLIVAAGIVIMLNAIFWDISRGDKLLEEFRNNDDFRVEDLHYEQTSIRLVGLIVSLICGALWIVAPPLLIVVLIEDKFVEKRKERRNKEENK